MRKFEKLKKHEKIQKMEKKLGFFVPWIFCT